MKKKKNTIQINKFSKELKKEKQEDSMSDEDYEFIEYYKNYGLKKPKQDLQQHKNNNQVVEANLDKQEQLQKEKQEDSMSDEDYEFIENYKNYGLKKTKQDLQQHKNNNQVVEANLDKQEL
ncbi:hypothetical protein ABPG74_015928 [Tetrahymena malaccensis]